MPAPVIPKTFSGSCEELRLHVQTIGIKDVNGQSQKNSWGWTSYWILANGQAKDDFDGQLTSYTIETTLKGSSICVQATNVKVEFSAEITIQIFDWDYPTKTPAECIRTWNELSKKILSHENHHVDDIEKIINTANQRWLRHPAFDACETKKAQAIESLDKKIAEAVKKEIDTIMSEIKTKAASWHNEQVDMDCSQCQGSKLKQFTIDPHDLQGEKSTNGTVTLVSKAPKDGVEILLKSDNPAAIVPHSVKVKSGQTTASFKIDTIPVSNVTYPKITATSQDLTLERGMTIRPPFLADLITPSKLKSGESGKGTVILSGKSPGNFVVTLETTPPLSVPALVIVDKGEKQAEFDVNADIVHGVVHQGVTARGGGHDTRKWTEISP